VESVVSQKSGNRPFKVGLFIPMPPSWSDARALALRAEEVGFDSVWVMDHLIMKNASGPLPVWEGWSLLSALAAITQRVELGTLVVATSFRNPTLLAKMADAVEEISGGRLILGLGAGWHEPEYRAFGYPFDYRVSRFEEAFTIVRTLLRTSHIDLAGRYYEARDCELVPRGPRPQGPPILIGAGGERMLHLTATHADLWNGCWYRAPDDADRALAAVDAACADVGRAPTTLGRTAGIWVETAETTGAGTVQSPLRESPAQLADRLRGFGAKGISHIQIRVDHLSLAAVDAIAPALELLDKSPGNPTN
jgi:alkanesulfonate monooxygenase SsuD/methylene tetrahydromethanopterin reductase-like flavin-dependent oxidoreductase (luciferase family)